MTKFRTLLWIVAINGSFFVARAQGTLHVEVTNIKEAKGNVSVALFIKEDDFLKKPYRAEKIKASGEKVIISFKDLPKGDYAISIFHDENENDNLDSNFMGIPKEGYGFGNDASGTFGPASFENSTIQFKGSTQAVGIKLKYF